VDFVTERDKLGSMGEYEGSCYNIDAIYTALYSGNYYKQSSSAVEFIRFHAKQVQGIEGEVEFLEEFEG